MDSGVQKLGRYYLLNRIAAGGFAEVYRAVLDAGDGMHRLVAVKCLHSDHGSDSEFSRAFRSEIKVSLSLAHPNIVPTYDFGAENGRPYIVFEYIHGRSLRQVLTRMSEVSRVLSVEHGSFLVEQSAAALHYAHSFKDPITREPLEIIHRDVSPQNILISFEGVPKVIDFGIAKVMQAATASITEDDRTRTGVIKGKPAYLSPEQIRGDTLDGRSDVFALGIVLWETLTGVRLFGGRDHSHAIHAIIDSTIKIEPPSNINPAVPAELDQIVMTSLARNREDRFRTAKELQNALMKFLARVDGAKSRDQYCSEISGILSEIFAEEITKDVAELIKLKEKVIELQGGRKRGHREFSLDDFTNSTIKKNSPAADDPEPDADTGMPATLARTLMLPTPPPTHISLEKNDRKQRSEPEYSLTKDTDIAAYEASRQAEAKAPEPAEPLPPPVADPVPEPVQGAPPVIEPSPAPPPRPEVKRPPPQIRPPKPQLKPQQPAPAAKPDGDRRVQDRRTRERQEPDRRAVQERRSPLRPVSKPEPTRPPEPVRQEQTRSEPVRPDRSQMTPIAYRPKEPARPDSFHETFLQTFQDFRKPSNFQIAVAAAALLLCFYLYNRINRHRLVEIPEDPDRVASSPPDRAPGASVPSSMIKPADENQGRADFEGAPEYKDYSVPPIDVAPGNSRVPRNDRDN